MKTKIITRTRFNLPHRIKTETVNPSLTVPGETMTIQQIFARSATMGGFSMNAPAVDYLDVENIQDIDSMYKTGHDLTELQQHADNIKELNTKIQAQIKLKQKDEALVKKQAEKDAIIKAHNDELNDKKAKTDSTE